VNKQLKEAAYIANSLGTQTDLTGDVSKKVEKEREVIKEIVEVEKIVEVPVEKIIERIVHVPVERVVEKVVEVVREVKAKGKLHKLDEMKDDSGFLESVKAAYYEADKEDRKYLKHQLIHNTFGIYQYQDLFDVDPRKGFRMVRDFWHSVLHKS